MKRISGGHSAVGADATLLSSHAGGPRTAAGDTSFAGQTWQSRRDRHESARRRPEDLPAGSDVTGRTILTLTVTVVRPSRMSSRNDTPTSPRDPDRYPLRPPPGTDGLLWLPYAPAS